jgi:uncharacterized protein YozE (UPF0346 family)
MKKLIGLLIILMFGVNTLGQTTGMLAHIKKASEYAVLESMTLGDHSIPKFIDNFYTNSMYMARQQTYSFVVDKKLYILSYDLTASFYCGSVVYKDIPVKDSTFNYFTYTMNFPDWHAERNIYLYCWDNGNWNKASDIVQRDNWGIDNAEITADRYFPRQTKEYMESPEFNYHDADSIITMLPDGVVEIKMIRAITVPDVQVAKLYNIKYRFTPIGNGMYKSEIISIKK